MSRKRKTAVFVLAVIAALAGAGCLAIVAPGLPSDVAGNAVAGGVAMLLLWLFGLSSLAALLLFVWNNKQRRNALIKMVCYAAVAAGVWVMTDGLRAVGLR